ncbi:MAG TPA: Asp-tRNA(Asn)/Glu-tRNA(Gln) amidotransferase subunit GatB [Sphingobacteriaceae bacterium]
MISVPKNTDPYELVVGLEVHVQLSTATKIFSADSAAFGAGPNENISSVSLGLPGTLPFTNAKVVEYAVKMGLALKCAINLENRFDRKNYFYADLPKGYQITQDALPICKEGYLAIKANDESTKKIRVNRIHMEEDAGKSIHDQDEQDSLIDLNRAGVPLIEIVSEPDIRTADEAGLYLSEIRKIVRFLGISDGNMEEGSLRCDANISVRKKGETSFGNRCEVKNLNSIRNLQRAIGFEFQRQVDLLEKGETVEQNTLAFDAATGATSPLRSKEMANDYRYFPEPDLPPVVLTTEYVEVLNQQLPELPEQMKERFSRQYGLSDYDSNLLASEKDTADYFEQVCLLTGNYKAVANWVNGPLRAYQNETRLPLNIITKPARLSELIGLIDEGKLSFSVASQQMFAAMVRQPARSVNDLAVELNVLISTDEAELNNLVEEVLNLYPDKVAEYKKGKKGVLGLFMGEFMKRSKGKADPKTANSILVKKLEEA